MYSTCMYMYVCVHMYMYMYACVHVHTCMSWLCVCVSVLQLMCDEYEQKLDRLKALDKKIEELKQKQGEFNLSGTVYTHCIAFITHILFKAAQLF